MADDTRKTPASKPSIASHRLFPLIVLLWFGALFGLASLAIRPVLLESVVAATGIDKVVPMAAPPLGNTARILIVLMMTVLGCLVGAVVARRLAKPVAAQPAVRRRRAAAETAPSMIEDASPVGLFGAAADTSDDDEEGEDDQPVRRRRQLALLPDEDTFEDRAPLPGNQILSVSELPLKSFDEVDEVWLHSSVRSPAPAATAAEPEPESGDAVAPVADEIADSHKPEPRANPLFESYARRVNASVESGEAMEEPAPGFVSLVPVQTEEAPAASAPQDGPAYANTAERIAAAPLDTLSHVELLERLAQTIARRRAQTSTVTPAPIEPATPAPIMTPQPPHPISEMPAALRPHWMDHEDAEDDALPAAIPARSIGLKPVVIPSENPGALEEGYSSLLGMTKLPVADPNSAAPAQELVNGFARIEEPADASLPQPPVFAFPGLQDVAPPPPERRAFDAPRSEDPAPDQTEQALRAALATLRRMSGTG